MEFPLTSVRNKLKGVENRIGFPDFRLCPIEIGEMFSIPGFELTPKAVIDQLLTQIEQMPEVGMVGFSNGFVNFSLKKDLLFSFIQNLCADQTQFEGSLQIDSPFPQRERQMLQNVVASSKYLLLHLPEYASQVIQWDTIQLDKHAKRILASLLLMLEIQHTIQKEIPLSLLQEYIRSWKQWFQSERIVVPEIPGKSHVHLRIVQLMCYCFGNETG